jgi:hypothetical protein
MTERMADLRHAIEKIQRRGGHVVMYRSPVADGIQTDEERRFPAATWVPRVAGWLNVPVIDFTTIPRLQRLDLPDGEHLEADEVPDVSDAVGRALLDVLGSRPGLNPGAKLDH